jgi:hypothetical protein
MRFWKSCSSVRSPNAHADKKTPARWQLCGVFSTPYGFYAVVKAQGRGALHYHLLFWGSYAPHVLAQAANMPEFKTRLEQALMTQTVAELPREMHVDRLRARGLRAKGLANNDAPLPRMARVPLDAQALDASSILLRARQCASAQCVHAHTSTCHKGKQGKCWYRVCKPEGYQETCTNNQVELYVQLFLLSKHGIQRQESKTIASCQRPRRHTSTNLTFRARSRDRLRSHNGHEPPSIGSYFPT